MLIIYFQNFKNKNYKKEHIKHDTIRKKKSKNIRLLKINKFLSTRVTEFYKIIERI